MSLVIGLTGFAQSGKDTVGQILGKYGFKRLAFADALRDGLLALDPLIPFEADHVRLSWLINTSGWDEAKVHYPEVRRLLQRYGTEAGRDIHGQDCWTDIVKRQVARIPGDGRVVITDVRFPNEVQLVRRYGGLVWRLERADTGPVNDHVSDNLDLETDVIILNNAGLHELATTVDHAVSRIL